MMKAVVAVVTFILYVTLVLSYSQHNHLHHSLSTRGYLSLFASSSSSSSSSYTKNIENESNQNEVDLLLSAGVSPVHITMYNSLLINYAKIGDVTNAVEVFNRMTLNDVGCTSVTFEHLSLAWLNSIKESSTRATNTTALNEAEAAFYQIIKAGNLPTKSLCVALMSAFGNNDMPERVEEIFDRLSFSGITYDADIYNQLLSAWGHSSHVNAAMYAEEIYHRMLFADIDANSDTYELLVSSWHKRYLHLSSDGSNQCARKAYEILKVMIKKGYVPSMKTFERVISTCSSSSRAISNTYMIDIVSDVLQIMKGSGVTPTELCYDLFTEIWSVSGREDTPLVLQEMYQSMYSLGYSLGKVLPLLIVSWTRSRLPGALHRAHDWIILAKSKSVTLPSSSFVAVIDAYSYANDIESAESVLDLLILQDHVNKNTTGYTPSGPIPWNCVIASYSRCINKKKSVISIITDMKPVNFYAGKYETAMRAEKLYKQMVDTGIEPDLWTYSSLISIWTQCGNPLKAESILNHMISNGVNPTSYTYMALLQGWIDMYNSINKSSIDSSSSIIYTDADRDTPVPKIKEIFRSMCMNYIHTVNNAVTPISSASSYMSTMQLLLDDEDSSTCEEALDKILSVNIPLDLDLYNTVLRVVSCKSKATYQPLVAVAATKSTGYLSSSLSSSSSSLSAAEKAINIFGMMVASNIKVNVESYELLIQSFENSYHSKLSIPDKAQEAIDHMISVGLVPSKALFETVIRILVNSNRPDSPKLAEMMFKRMVTLTGVDPPPRYEVFMLLIDGWSRSIIPNAVKKAVEVYQTMLYSNIKPTALTYSLLAYAWCKQRYSFHSIAYSNATATTPTATTPTATTTTTTITTKAATPTATATATTPTTPTATTPNATTTATATAASVATTADNPVHRIEELYQTCIDNGETPLASMYRSLFTIYCKERSPRSLLQAERLLLDMSTVPNSKHPLASMLHPSFYSLLVSCWGLDAIGKAEAFIDSVKLSIGYSETSIGSSDSRLYIGYNLLLAAYVRVSPSTSCLEAEDVYYGCIQKMQQLHPDDEVVSINLLLDCYIKSRRSDITSRCDALLSTNGSNRSRQIYPNDYTFNLMSHIHCDDKAERAKALFDRLCLRHVTPTVTDADSDGDTHAIKYTSVGVTHAPDGNYNRYVHVPSKKAFCTMIEIMSDTDAFAATQYLDDMLMLQLQPPDSLFSTLISVWAKASRLDMCERIFDRIVQIGRKPDMLSCRVMLSAVASSDRTDTAERIEALIKCIVQAGVVLNSYMVMSQIQAWSRASSPFAAKKIETTIETAIASGIQPTNGMFHILIDMHGKSKAANAPLTAELWLDKMISHKLEPSIMTYNCVIAAWGRSNRAEALVKAFHMLDKAVSNAIVPDVITYSSLLSALSKSLDTDAPTKASAIFEQMQSAGIKADTVAWTILITIWSRSKDSSKEEKVQVIFDDMIRSGIMPNAVTYTALLTMWSNSKNQHASARIIEIFKCMRHYGQALDTVGYSSLLSALSKSLDTDAPTKASAIFEQMQSAGIKADTVAWTILITIWSRSKDSSKEEKVQVIFDDMIRSGIMPNAVTYTALLTMWSNSKNQHASARILEIYGSICSDYVRLDGFGFRVMLQALKKVLPTPDYVHKAETLLVRMTDYGMPPDVLAWESLITAYNLQRNYSQSIYLFNLLNQQVGVSPSRDIYSSIFEASLKLNLPNTYEITEDLIQSMMKHNLQPSAKEYNSMLLTLVRSNNYIEDYSLKARDVFKRMKVAPGGVLDRTGVALLIEIHTHSKEIQDIEYAEDIFHEVELNKKSLISTDCINHLLGCYSNLKANTPDDSNVTLAKLHRAMESFSKYSLTKNEDTYLRYFKIYAYNTITLQQWSACVQFIEKEYLPMLAIAMSTSSSSSSSSGSIKKVDNVRSRRSITFAYILTILTKRIPGKLAGMEVLQQLLSAYGSVDKKAHLPKINEYACACKSIFSSNSNSDQGIELCKQLNVVIL